MNIVNSTWVLIFAFSVFLAPNDNVTAMVSQTLIIIDHAGRQVHVINLYLFHSKYVFFLHTV